MQSLKIPLRFQESIDLGSVTIRSKPFHDNEVNDHTVQNLFHTNHSHRHPFFLASEENLFFFIFLCRNFFPCVTAVPPRIHF